ncbi:hypothetical protein HNQ60_001132 [Povalibacter uvarum]|uniref:Uncharacterized protein n=1 Tax=Povalibacter uvarum TaxID=732238 RepID=A0A841HHM4_9GAMM|nr:hypothetical protein [Povalibacter uvarum]MBB6092286.1 hypothetical protein [Povalibacter uvarum]
MHRLSALILAALCGLPFGPGYACQRGSDETAFDKVAPTASDIIAVQVEALVLEAEHLPDWHHVRGKIRVLKHYRGSARFTELRYLNSMCGGLRMDVGGIYLIATNSPGPSIELNVLEAPVLQIRGPYPADPEVVLRLDASVKRLMAALQGEADFQITTPAARYGLQRDTQPPPRVPHPDEFKDE